MFLSLTGICISNDYAEHDNKLYEKDAEGARGLFHRKE